MPKMAKARKLSVVFIKCGVQASTNPIPYACDLNACGVAQELDMGERILDHIAI